MSISYNSKLNRRQVTAVKGSGLLNTLINKLPVELHIPNYNFCGPGTKLSKRLARGDEGINQLDDACKAHDIAYSQFTDIEKRHEADKILKRKALERLKASDASIGEKIASLGVSGAMAVKTKLGMGLHKKRKGKGLQSKNGISRKRRSSVVHKKGRGLSFSGAVKKARKSIMGMSHSNLKTAAKTALASIKKGHVLEPKKRILPIPKSGGFLPLIPLFAALSALGAIGGGAGTIATSVINAKNAREKLEEEKRHNKAMEQVTVGKGLYLKPYKQGCGLYLKPYPKNC